MIINKHFLIIILLGFLIYSNTLKNPYLWDDKYFIEKGNFIKSFKNTWLFFSPNKYFKYTQDQTYRPLPFLALMLDYKISKLDPLAYRLTNICLHIINAILLYLLIFYLFKNNFVAFLSGLFFVVHPVNTEVVNMVSFVETQISTLFFLLAFLCYVKSNELGLAMTEERDVIARALARSNLYFFSVLCYFLAVFSKEIAITLPAVIILYDFIFGSVIARSVSDEAIPNEIATPSARNDTIKRYIPFFAITVFYLVVRFFVFRHPTETMLNYPGNSFITNIFTMLKTIPIYLTVIFFPISLSVDHQIAVSYSFLEKQVLAGFFLLLGFLGITVSVYKKSLSDNQVGKLIFFWIMWFFITFLPTSNIIPMGNIVAERYLYLPLIGICVLLAMFSEKLSSRCLSVGYGVAFCIIIFFSALTIIRNIDWKDTFTFYFKTLKQVPLSPQANMNMGVIYAEKKDFKKAEELISYALELNPNYPDAKWALASTFYKAGDYDKAIELFEQIAQENQYQSSRAPFTYLGLIYKAKKDYNKALENFNKALILNPLSAVVYIHIAEIYEAQKNIEEAIKYYEKSIEINPADYIPFNALGVIFGRKGDYDISLKYLNRALKLAPNSAIVHYNTGFIYFLTHQYGEALKKMGTTLQLEPTHNSAKLITDKIIGKSQHRNYEKNR